MIVVIADDFTGAAEISGIALRFGLKAELCTEVRPCKASVMVISADTRSMPKHHAVAKMASITGQVISLKPSLIYKKVDSALRGHITAEIKEHLTQLHLKRALLVAANPSHNRSVINGEYLLDNKPLHLSDFANDPEFPTRSSHVRDILENSILPVHIRKHHDHIVEEEGIIAGDVAGEHDLQAWAAKSYSNTLLCGGADFFEAMLTSMDLGSKTTNNTIIDIKEHVLVVSGTTYNQSVTAIANLKNAGKPVSYMPVEVANCNFDGNTAGYDEWCADIISQLKSGGKAIIAINKPDVIHTNAAMLRTHMANVISAVFKQTSISELFIEGGSTAAAILSKLALTSFCPLNEFEPGVLRMRCNKHNGLHVTVKPGSYAWPRFLYNYTLY
jgi:uncharacterized protein YgbK (DUF1537 family)